MLSKIECRKRQQKQNYTICIGFTQKIILQASLDKWKDHCAYNENILNVRLDKTCCRCVDRVIIDA